MKTTKHATKTLITLSAFTLMGSLTYGANIFWIGDTDGAWEDTGNWSTTTGGSGGADPSNNQLFIEGTTNPDVTLSSVDAVTRVLIDQGRTLYIASGGTLTGTSSIAVIGDNSLGNLVVQDGGTYNRTGTLDTRFDASSVTVEDGGTINLGNWSAEGSGGFNISGSTADVTIGNITTTGNGVDNSTLTLNSASLSVTGNMTWDGAGSSALSIGAGSTLNLTGAAASHTLTDGIEITGGGQVNLSGTLDANANTINITDANSTFQLGSGGTGGAINTSSSVTIGSGGTFVINQSDAVTQGTEFGDSISGAGSIEQAGTGTTTLNVANSHTGGTTLSSGTLVLGDAAAAGTGAITLSGGTLEIAANIANDISAVGSTTIVNNTGTLSLNGGSVTGTGTLAFSVASQTRLFSDLSGFSGTISHDNDAGGQLRLWNQPADLSGTKIVTSGGTSGGGLLFINSGNDHTIGELSGTGGTILMRGGNGLTLTVDQSTDTTYSGLLQDGDANRIGTLVKDGTGSLTLDGVNTYSGGTTLNEGHLHLGAIGAAGTGTLTLSGGTLTGLGINTQQTNDIFVADGTTTQIYSEGGDNRYGGEITGTGTLSFGGVADSASMRIYANGAGLSGFSGTIAHDNVNGGNNLFLESGNGSLTTGAKIFTSGDTSTNRVLRFRGNWEIGELSGTGGKIIGWNDSSLTVNQSTDTTYSGLLADNDVDRKLVLIKDGAGTLTLDFDNTYTGTTTVDTGTLIIDGIQSSATGAMTINVNGTLGGSGTIGASLLTVNGVIAPGNSPGTLTTGSQLWNIGGSYLWEINDSGGSKGGTTGWDWLDIDGDLNLASLSAGGFTIDIDSLNSSDLTGTADGFDYSGLAYGDAYGTTFIIATADTITGFESGDFILDDSGFVNGKLEWSISESGTDLVLSAVFVPEPSSTALLGLGGLALMLRRKR